MTMPKLNIDHREVEVPPGATVLEAARKLGIDIPTLCFLEGCEAVDFVPGLHGEDRASRGRSSPSCATAAADGMDVESETEEVRQLRRTALELLLSDHVGDCLAPCYSLARRTWTFRKCCGRSPPASCARRSSPSKRDIALPAVLGRICPKPCEKGVPPQRARRRRGRLPVEAISRPTPTWPRREPYCPPAQPATGKRVAIVGAGPTGLSAAYYLAQQGHACMIFDDKPAARRADAARDARRNCPPKCSTVKSGWCSALASNCGAACGSAATRRLRTCGKSSTPF